MLKHLEPSTYFEFVLMLGLSDRYVLEISEISLSLSKNRYVAIS